MQTLTSSFRASPCDIAPVCFRSAGFQPAPAARSTQSRQSEDVKAVFCVAEKMEGVCYFTVTVTS